MKRKPIDITLDMCIEELERRKQYFEIEYPKLIEKNKISPYQRDEAVSVNKKLLSLLNQAKRNKSIPGAKTFIQLIDELPVSIDHVTGELTIDMCINELNHQAKYCKRERAKINSKLLTLLNNSRFKR